MKKLLTSVLIATAISSAFISGAIATTEKETGYISVSASTTQEVSPNQVEITINVETFDKSLQKASANNKIAAEKVLNSIKPLLGPNDFLKTKDFTASPVYSYTKDNKKVLDKYQVTNSVLVKTKNIQLASKLVDTAILNGATSVNDLQFSVASYEDACNSTLADLTKKAMTQAGAIANSLNSKITGTKSIGATCSPQNDRPYIYMAKGALDNESATPIEAGKVRIYANIDAAFYVK